jgi:Leucine-rich repeat (LRR) protein
MDSIQNRFEEELQFTVNDERHSVSDALQQPNFVEEWQQQQHQQFPNRYTISNYGQHEVPPEQAPSTSTNIIMESSKDVPAVVRWGFHNYTEVFFYVTFIVTVISSVTLGIMHTTKHSTLSADLNVPSAYELPIRSKPTNITDQEELDMILYELSSNSILSTIASSIPNTVTAVVQASVDKTDPFLLATSWLTATDTTNAKEHAIARFALATFFYSSNGDNWYNNTNWLSDEHYCNWYGVVCCEHTFGSTMCLPGDFGHIVEIDLFRNNVTGTISPALVMLPHLQSLYLSENKLSGTIPGHALGSLQHLTKLWVSHNLLSGTIPSELIGNNVFSKCKAIHELNYFSYCRRHV